MLGAGCLQRRVHPQPTLAGGRRVGSALITFSVNVLIPWRVCSLIIGVVSRPGEPAARLIDVPDKEARHLAWFVSATILVVITLVGFAR
jgi:hypothetical protein